MPQLPTFKQVKSIALVVLSGKDKKLQAERDAICGECEHLRKHVTRSRYTNKLQVDSHCSKCGCGTRPMSGLRKNKNAYRKLSCPLKKWPGDEEDRGGLSIHEMSKLVNVYDRLELQLATVQMQLDDGKALTDEQFNEMSGQELQRLKMMQGQNMMGQGAFPGVQPNPKAGAAAAAAKVRPAAKSRPLRKLAVGDQTSKDQIPDKLVRQNFRKVGAPLLPSPVPSTAAESEATTQSPRPANPAN